jgi:membrane fusion protein (multidrug efflux system)
VNQDASTVTPAREKTGTASWRWIALLVLLAATIGGVLLYWRHTEIYPSTDNAYTGANVVRVASQINGVVKHVYVQDDD